MDTVVKKLNEIADQIAGSDVEDAETVAEGLIAIGNAFGGEGEQTESVVKALDYIKENISGGGSGDLAQFTVANGSVEFTWVDFGGGYGAYVHELNQDAYNFLVDNFDEARDENRAGFYYRLNNSYGVYTTTLEENNGKFGLESEGIVFYFWETPDIPGISPSVIMLQDEHTDDTITVPLRAFIYFGK